MTGVVYGVLVPARAAGAPDPFFLGGAARRFYQEPAPALPADIFPGRGAVFQAAGRYLLDIIAGTVRAAYSAGLVRFE